MSQALVTAAADHARIRRLVMIEKIRLQNFKGHADTTVPLGRLTALVGSNASGKTSVLEALSLLSMLAPSPYEVLRGDWAPKDLMRRNSTSALELAVSGHKLDRGAPHPWGFKVQVLPDSSPSDEWRAILRKDPSDGMPPSIQKFKFDESGQTLLTERGTPWSALGSAFKRVPLYSLDAKAIAASAFGIGESDQVVDERGTNATAALANMKLERDEDFERVQLALRRLVPSVRKIRLHPVRVGATAGHKIYFDFQGASAVPAHGASHGTLVALALLTILYGPNRPDLLLLDDFDHSLHPQAQLELMKMLKELLEHEDFADLQIVMTTHSPYILDRLDADQVRVFTLRDGSVVSKGLDEHPDAASSRGMVSSGQLWSTDAEKDWVLGG